MKVKELLSDESKWTQDTRARDKEGCKCHPSAEVAACWCLLGAVDKCYNEESILTKIEDKLKGRRVSLWNDEPDRTFEEVRQLVEELDI